MHDLMGFKQPLPSSQGRIQEGLWGLSPPPSWISEIYGFCRGVSSAEPPLKERKIKPLNTPLLPVVCKIFEEKIHIWNQNLIFKSNLRFCQRFDIFKNCSNVNFYSILRDIFIPHFYSQFHDFGYNKFLICSEANK